MDIHLLTNYYRPRGIFPAKVEYFTLNQQTGSDTLAATTGFSKVSSSTISSSTTTAYAGTRSVKCITPNAGAAEGVATIPSIDILPSRTYTFSVRASMPSGSGTVKAKLNGRNSSDGTVGSSYSDVVTLDDTWKEITVTRDMGASEVKCQCSIYTDVQQGITFYTDAWSLRIQ